MATPNPPGAPGTPNSGAKRKSPAWKDKEAPATVYAILGKLGGKTYFIKCWELVAIHFGFTYEKYHFDFVDKTNVLMPLRPNCSRKIKLPKESNMTFAKANKKHKFYTIRVSSNLKLSNLSPMLKAAIKQNEPDYFVNSTGCRIYFDTPKTAAAPKK